MITLVSGIPGAGKSTVARRLAETASRSVHLEGDVVGEAFVVRGLVLPGGEPADEADAQLALRRRNTAALATAFDDAGFEVVVDDVVLWPGLFETYLALLGPRAWRFVVLAPRLDVVQTRDAGRDKHVFEVWQHLDDDLRSWTDQPGLRLDTSDLDADATVAEVLARGDEALVSA